jgi:hypothetical protein
VKSIHSINRIGPDLSRCCASFGRGSTPDYISEIPSRGEAWAYLVARSEIPDRFAAWKRTVCTVIEKALGGSRGK